MGLGDSRDCEVFSIRGFTDIVSIALLSAQDLQRRTHGVFLLKRSPLPWIRRKSRAAIASPSEVRQRSTLRRGSEPVIDLSAKMELQLCVRAIPWH